MQVTAPSTATTPATASMPSGINLGLSRITSLLTALRSPHLTVPVVHIAGTNGKGSISAYLSSILTQPSTNLRCGRFTSPHLVDEWDCLQIDGRTIDRSSFEQTMKRVKVVDEEEAIGASSFEILTATAYSLFDAAVPQLDLAIVEVGMGGRTDATNVVPSSSTLLSIVSSIELDHQAFLGTTLREIASVKGEIVREGNEVVVAHQAHEEVREVMREIAVEMQSNVYFSGVATRQKQDEEAIIPLFPSSVSTGSSITSSATASTSTLSARLPLPGSYQLANAAAAVLAVQILRSSPRTVALLPLLASITDETIRLGIEATRWPGRLDWIDLALSSSSQNATRILIDGAHNPSSAILLSNYLTSLPTSLAPTTLIIGLSAPRPPLSILEPLLRENKAIKRIFCVGFEAPPSMAWIRATAPEEIVDAVRSMNLDSVTVMECNDVEEALLQSGSGENRGERETVVVAGSLYLAADVYRLQRRLALES